MESSIPNLRILREAEEPLGLFFRPGEKDHKILSQLLSENVVGMSGGVFDPSHCGFQEALRGEISNRSLDAILDPRMLELSSAGGHTKLRAALPWARSTPHKMEDFGSSFYVDECAQRISDFIAEHRFSGVLAPTHFLGEGNKDGWASIDQKLTTSLRRRLDQNGCQKTIIHYPLATTTRLLIDKDQRQAIKEMLARLPIDRLWLRIHPFGSESGDTLLSRYILACRDLHDLNIPIIAEKTGVLGLALLAFGAVSGLESGIASGEKFDFNRLKKISPKPKPGQKFGRAGRVYVPTIGVFLKKDQAGSLLELRNFRHLCCTNSKCCPRGAESMLNNHRRHFTYARMDEVGALGKYPAHLRANGYLESILRPATDNIGRVLASDKLPDALRKKLDSSAKRLAGWRQTLGEMAKQEATSFSAPLERLITRTAFTA